MNINKKYAVFGAAAVIAIAGVIYFGTSANQQASVATVADKLAGPSIPIGHPVPPITTEFEWRKLCRDGAPHIQVLSPNGGEVYQVGQQVTVKWRTCNDNSDSSVSAILTTNQSSNNRLLGHSSADINTATFTIPSTLSGLNNTTVPIVSGQYYKINLELRTNFGTNDLMASDNSNNTFTINEITGLSTTLASTLNPVSTVSSTSGAVTSVLYRIRLNVTANRSDFYIPRGATFIKGANTATVPSLVSPQNGISFGILNESNLYVDGATAGRIATPATEVSSSVSIVSGASVDPSGRIKVPQGQTAVFDIAVTISEGIVSSDVFGRYKIGILSVNGATTSIGAISNFNTTPVVNYQTQFNSPAFQ